MKKKILFLDRDGVINEDKGYVFREKDFSILPNVIEGLTEFKKKGFYFIIITNQSGIARGYYKIENFNVFMNKIITTLKQFNIQIMDYYFCPHHPTGKIKSLAIDCSCRKPKPGMILKAMQDYNVDINLSVLVGDNISDIEAGISAGITKNIIIGSSKKYKNINKSLIFETASDLLEASKLINN